MGEREKGLLLMPMSHAHGWPLEAWLGPKELRLMSTTSKSLRSSEQGQPDQGAPGSHSEEPGGQLLKVQVDDGVLQDPGLGCRFTGIRNGNTKSQHGVSHIPPSPRLISNTFPKPTLIKKKI